MNKKGFTLVELLAVIVILSSISVIVVVSVTSSLGRREEKECEEQVALAINAAKIYFSLEKQENIKIHNGNKTVTVKCLKGGDNCNDIYLDENKTNKLCDGCTIMFDGNEYKMYETLPSETVDPDNPDSTNKRNEFNCSEDKKSNDVNSNDSNN